MAAYSLRVVTTLALLFAAAGSLRADYMTTVLASNPVSYYRLGEASGPTAFDSSGNAHNGTYLGGVTFGVPGAIVGDPNTAVTFNGTNGHVDTAQVLGNDFSIETWVKTTATSLSGTQAFQGNGLVWSDVGGVANDWILADLNNRAAFFTGNPDTTISGTTPLNDGNWHYIVATRDKTAGIKRLYVDSVLQATGTTNNNTLNANNRIEIGGNTLDGRYFNGSMDETAYYTSVLTQSQITTHFLVGQAVPEPASVALVAGAFVCLAGFVWKRRPRQR
jgi:hypothetical protein